MKGKDSEGKVEEEEVHALYNVYLIRIMSFVVNAGIMKGFFAVKKHCTNGHKPP